MNVYGDNGSNILLNSSQDTTGGNKISYAYAKGALTTMTDTQGRTISFTYTDPNNPTQASTITDNSLGRTINLTYGRAVGGVVQDRRRHRIADSVAYNAAGKISSITDGLSQVTAFTYERQQPAADVDRGIRIQQHHAEHLNVDLPQRHQPHRERPQPLHRGHTR